jgi:hypothetical protein
MGFGLVLRLQPSCICCCSVVAQDLDIDRVVVVELNPWGPSTDSGLFSFKNEEATVLRKTGAFDFRVRTEVAAGIREYWASAQKEWLTVAKD